MSTCAIWYWSHGSIYYSLCDNEQMAAAVALDMVDGADAAVEGVQFSDGTYLDKDDWPEYAAEDKRRWDQTFEQAREEMERPKRATRKIKVPWGDDDRTITVYADDAPAWLGGTPAVSDPTDDPAT